MNCVFASWPRVYNPLGPHPGARRHPPGPRLLAEPVATASPTCSKSGAVVHGPRWCHPGVLPAGREHPSRGLNRTRRPNTGTRFEPRHGKHFPRLRKPGTPHRPSTDFHVHKRHAPGPPVASRNHLPPRLVIRGPARTAGQRSAVFGRVPWGPALAAGFKGSSSPDWLAPGHSSIGSAWCMCEPYAVQA